MNVIYPEIQIYSWKMLIDLFDSPNSKCLFLSPVGIVVLDTSELTISSEDKPGFEEG